MQSQTLTETPTSSLQLLFFAIPFLLGINIDLVTPALPVLAANYHASVYLAQLTVSIYIFAYGISQLFLGTLSDSFGRKHVLLPCALIYVAVSIAAGFAANIYLLLVCRFMQGATLAGMAVVVRAVATDLYQGKALRKAINAISISWALGPILGPFFGSYLQHYFSWRADFYFFALYGILIFFGIKYLMPETKTQRVKFDPRVVLQNMRKIVACKIFVLTALIGALLYTILILFNLIAPFVLENILHLSVITYGRIALLMGFAYFTGNCISYFLVNKFKTLQIIMAGLITALIFCALMVTCCIFIPLSTALIVAPSLLIFLACGITFPSVSSTFSSIFTEFAGTASAIAGTFMVGGVTLLSGLISMFHVSSALPLAAFNLAIVFICLIFTLPIVFKQAGYRQTQLV